MYIFELVFFFVFVFVFCFFLFRPPLRHMEVPRLGVESELQLPAYATATATSDPIWVCDLHLSSQQCWILNPLSEIRDRTHTFMDTTQVCNPLSRDRNSSGYFFKIRFKMLILLPGFRRGFFMNGC